MLPSLIAREIKTELDNFLSSTFPVSTVGFQGQADMGLMEQSGFETQEAVMARFKRYDYSQTSMVVINYQD